MRVTHGNEFAAGLNHQAVCAFHPVARGQDGLFQTHVLQAVGNEMQKNLAVAGGLKNGPGVFQFGAKLRRIGQIAIVRKRKLHAAPHAHRQRLGIARFGPSGGGIAHMPHGYVSRQMHENFLGKYIGTSPMPT